MTRKLEDIKAKVLADSEQGTGCSIIDVQETWFIYEAKLLKANAKAAELEALLIKAFARFLKGCE